MSKSESQGSLDETELDLDEEIRKVAGGYKVYPMKPKKGHKRREALSKKPLTYKKALSQLRAIERSKSLNESNQVKIKDEFTFDGTLAIKVNDNLIEKGEIEVCLYWQDRDPQEGAWGNIVGAFKLRDATESLGEPCIPKTMELGEIHVAKQYQNKGYGRILYNLVFYVANSRGYGVTSDHADGTKAIAAIQWLKFANYIKQKTPAGNDTFDYNKSTPDPNDDCVYLPNDGSKPATDHSFVHPSWQNHQSVYDSLILQHTDNLLFALDNEISEEDFNYSLEDDVTKSFEREIKRSDQIKIV